MDILILCGGVAVGAGGCFALTRRRIRMARRRDAFWSRLVRELVRASGNRNSAAQPDIDSPEYLDLVQQAWIDARRDQGRLQAVLAAIPEGIALLDSGTRVIFLNAGFATMFRGTLGQPLRMDSVGPGDDHTLASALRVAREMGVPKAVEVHLATTPPRDVLVRCTPYSDEGIENGLILTAIDISAQKRAEVLRSEFVANVSHELRTPLAAIRGYVETCLEPSSPDSPPPYARFLPVVHQHALRLNALIEDLLTLSRIESRGMQLKIAPLHIHPLVETAVSTLASEANKKRIAIVNAVPQLLPEARADQASIERVLFNLVENAIKYSDEDSEVLITARTHADALCLVVEDRGVGIPREDQQRIFERFYRVDKARSRKAGGTGLGLSIVKHLVQANGGEVWVDSEPGRGSTFFFTLPMAHATEELARV